MKGGRNESKIPSFLAPINCDGSLFTKIGNNKILTKENKLY